MSFEPETVEKTLKSGKVVKIAELSAKAFQDFIRPTQAGSDKEKKAAAEALTFRMISACLTDDAGKTYIVEEVEKFSSKVVRELEKLILAVNGLGEEAKDEAKND